MNKVQTVIVCVGVLMILDGILLMLLPEIMKYVVGAADILLGLVTVGLMLWSARDARRGK